MKLLIHSDMSFLTLIIIDAAAYNLKANKIILKKDLIWSTCFSHLLHNATKKLYHYQDLLTHLIFQMNDLVNNTVPAKTPPVQNMR